jgi:hypothetical protein
LFEAAAEDQEVRHEEDDGGWEGKAEAYPRRSLGEFVYANFG